jgi:murein DD-endopeptidase MepM/ murein hydrolase activator NlpD
VNAGTISPVSTPPRDLADAKDRVFLRFNADDAAGLFDLYSESMKAAVPAEKTSSFLRSVLSAKGRWLSSDALSTDPLHGVWRVHAERGDWTLEIHVAPKGLITGLRVTDAAEPPVTQSTIVLGLPFRGEWLVHWGGDRSDVNHHVGARDQRRAADLVIVDGDGKTYRGEGKSNADYLAYGQDVLAVADGTVVTVVDGVPENEPGAMNRYVVPGNFVILGHMPNLFSMYAHLQPGSIRMARGAKVARGAVVGLCGNSGNSSEPHLHFQLQDGAAMEKSWGVEAVFDGVLVRRNGAVGKTDRYTFLRGDRVRASP